MASPTLSDQAWREQWIETIQRRARTEIPALLRSAHAQRLQHMHETGAHVVPALPLTPVPTVPPGLPETGGIPRVRDRETAIISAIRLLQPAITVQETTSLVSQAVARFFERYHFLPNCCLLSPLRFLVIGAASFFPLDEECAELGCYTIRVACAPLPGDTIGLWGMRFDGTTVRDDF